MDNSLTASEQPLAKVFSSEYDFEIPYYQRPYRWGYEQVAQLMDDLTEALNRSESEPYFLGSLVLHRKSGNSFDIIDGQQRLTTLTIIFAVIRDLSKDQEETHELGRLIFEPGSKLTHKREQPRLRLRAQDREFFLKYVQTPNHISELIKLSDTAVEPEAQRAIRDNSKLIYDKLIEWDAEARSNLATLMLLRTFLVLVSTPELESAYRIFSVMNARGLDLTPTDIFKSTITGALGANTPYAKKWEDAEDALGSDDFTDLFIDIRTIETAERPRKSLLQGFPEQVLSKYNGNEADFVDKLLLPYTKAFEELKEGVGTTKEWSAVNNWLKRLALIDNKDWRPVALWALRNHQDDPEFLAAFFRRLERLAASFLLRGEYVTPRVTRYLELLNQLKDGAGLNAPGFELNQTESSEAYGALTGEIYRMQSKRARYILLRLDELLAGSPGATYDHNIITIEHVLPRHPGHDSGWTTNFTPEQREYWTDRLGNLLLLNQRKNSQASNYDFDKKKNSYFTTKSGSAIFALTTQVLKHDEWTPAVVEQRQRELVSTLATEWDLTLL